MKGVSRKSQRRFKKISRVFQERKLLEWLKDVSRVFQGRWKGVSIGFKRCLKTFEWGFEGSFKGVSRKIDGGSQEILQTCKLDHNVAIKCT